MLATLTGFQEPCQLNLISENGMTCSCLKDLSRACSFDSELRFLLSKETGPQVPPQTGRICTLPKAGLGAWNRAAHLNLTNTGPTPLPGLDPGRWDQEPLKGLSQAPSPLREGSTARGTWGGVDVTSQGGALRAGMQGALSYRPASLSPLLTTTP